MKQIRYLVLLLLLFNGVSAIYGGALLLADPSGAMLGLPLSYLKGSPFTDYFFPGLILFVAIGIFSLVVLLFTAMQWKYYSTLVILQGALLLAWLIIQILMIDILSFQHYIMGAVGFLLVMFGMMLHKRKTEKSLAVSPYLKL